MTFRLKDDYLALIDHRSFENGLIVFDSTKTKGRVIFSLADLDVGAVYWTERSNKLTRVTTNEVRLGDEGSPEAVTILLAPPTSSNAAPTSTAVRVLQHFFPNQNSESGFTFTRADSPSSPSLLIRIPPDMPLNVPLVNQNRAVEMKRISDHLVMVNGLLYCIAESLVQQTCLRSRVGLSLG